MNSVWQLKALGCVSTLQRGFDLPSSDRIAGDYPIISSGGISGYHNEAKVKGPGVVTGRYGSLGEAFFVEGDFWPLNTTLWVKDFHGNHEKFVYYLLSSLNFKKFSDKTGVPGVNRNDLHKIKVHIPSVSIQKKIVAILSIWDQAIEKIERLIAAKEKYLSSLKQRLLTGEKRINGYNESWRRYRLSEVLLEHGMLSTGQEKVYSVSVHKGLVNQIEHLGRSFAAKNTDNYNLVNPGDIVYTKSPTGDFPSGIIKQSQLDFPVIVSPLYGVFTPKTRQLGTFLHFYFESPVNTGNYLRPLIQKGAKNTIGISNPTFLSNSLFLPSCDDETKAIAITLGTARQEIDLLKKQTDAYRKQKHGLMQKLLTGQWRVKNDVP